MEQSIYFRPQDRVGFLLDVFLNCSSIIVQSNRIIEIGKYMTQHTRKNTCDSTGLYLLVLLLSIVFTRISAHGNVVYIETYTRLLSKKKLIADI